MSVEKRNLGPLKIPFPRSGSFGAVYKLTNQHQAFAVKVFGRAAPNQELRYQLIAEHLAGQPRSPHLAEFTFDPAGILIDRLHRWCPALVMDWVDGKSLDSFIDDQIRSYGRIDNRALCQAWIDVMVDLAHVGIAHGDLEHGNILVLPNASLKLVDYDSIFVPAMKALGLKSNERGSASYQHPKRNADYFDERVHDFAALVILLALASIDADRWRRYHTDDNFLIVRESDLLQPDQSPLFADLLKSSDAPIRVLTMLLMASASASLDEIPSFTTVASNVTIRQLLEPGHTLASASAFAAAPAIMQPPATPTPAQPVPAIPVPPIPPPPSTISAPPPTIPPPPPTISSTPTFTPAEVAVLQLMAQRQSVESIAHALAIREDGVRESVRILQTKTGVSSYGALVNWAITNGYYQPPAATYPPPAQYVPTGGVPPANPPPRPGFLKPLLIGLGALILVAAVAYLLFGATVAARFFQQPRTATPTIAPASSTAQATSIPATQSPVATAQTPVPATQTPIGVLGFSTPSAISTALVLTAATYTPGAPALGASGQTAVATAILALATVSIPPTSVPSPTATRPAATPTALAAAATRPALTPTRPASTPTALAVVVTVTRLETPTLEYNVVLQGTNYLLIHNNFQVRRADSAQVRVAAYLWYGDNTPMKGQVPAYTSLNGQASTGRLADIGDSGSVYPDFVLGIPQEAIATGTDIYVSVELQDAATNKVLARATSVHFFNKGS